MAFEFNGVTLPDLPAFENDGVSLADFPYVIILGSGEGGYIALCTAFPMLAIVAEGNVAGFVSYPTQEQNVIGYVLFLYIDGSWLFGGGVPDEPFVTGNGAITIQPSAFEGMVYANHDVMIVAGADDSGNLIYDGVFFANSDGVPYADYYIVKSETLVGLGDSVRNATGVRRQYSLEAMKTELDKLSKGAIANCNAVANMNTDEGYLSYYSDGVVIPTHNIASIASCMKGVIKRLEFPNVETVPNSALSPGNIGMVRPKEIVLNSATTIEFYAFTRQSELLKVIAPKVTELKRVFGYCVGLTEITKDCFPEVTRIDEGEFEYCTNLTRADFPKLQTIDGQVFRDTNMTVLILRNDSQVCTWEYWGTYSLINTPLRAGKGVVLVPAALVSEYESYGTSSSGNTWRDVYSSGSRFIPLEEYTVDGTLTGDIDWAKVDAELAKL